jgi:flagellar biogenesis protein FliO
VDSIAVSAGIEMAAVVMMVPAVDWIVPSTMESRNPQNRWVQVLATIDRAQ